MMEINLCINTKVHCLISAGPKAAKILVYEYVTNGSLLDYIIGKFNFKSITFSTNDIPTFYFDNLFVREGRKEFNLEGKSKYSHWSS